MRTFAGSGDHLRASTNGLLRSLSGCDQALIAPHGELLVAGCGAALLGSDEVPDAVFFPGSALVVVEDRSVPGKGFELAMVGREGMLGWPALLGADRAGHVATVTMHAGTLIRFPIEPLLAACGKSPSLLRTLLRFVHVIMTQMSRAVICGLQHPLDQRLARWLLMRHDRLGNDLVVIRHQEIADSLQVRRASVTDTLHVLEGRRTIRCARGQVVIRDRTSLEQVAGAAYGTAEKQYRMLFDPSLPIAAK